MAPFALQSQAVAIGHKAKRSVSPIEIGCPVTVFLQRLSSHSELSVLELNLHLTVLQHRLPNRPQLKTELALISFLLPVLDGFKYCNMLHSSVFISWFNPLHVVD